MKTPREEALEAALSETIDELYKWWADQDDYGTGGYEEWLPQLEAILKGEEVR